MFLHRLRVHSTKRYNDGRDMDSVFLPSRSAVFPTQRANCSAALSCLRPFGVRCPMQRGDIALPRWREPRSLWMYRIAGEVPLVSLHPGGKARILIGPLNSAIRGDRRLGRHAHHCVAQITAEISHVASRAGHSCPM